MCKQNPGVLQCDPRAIRQSSGEDIRKAANAIDNFESLKLPPLVRWEYAYTPEAGSREALLTEVFTRPQNWLDDGALQDRCAPHQAVG